MFLLVLLFLDLVCGTRTPFGSEALRPGGLLRRGDLAPGHQARLHRRSPGGPGEDPPGAQNPRRPSSGSKEKPKRGATVVRNSYLGPWVIQCAQDWKLSK